MIVVALGGCGGMGRHAVRTALEFDQVDQILIADRDKSRAAQFARSCGDKTAPWEIDVTNSKSLAKLLDLGDVVLNTVGPFYQLGVPILKTAIETGCNYLDINDDWEPTLEMLKLDEAAKNAGVTAVIGMGASPGISNLLAAKACERLDEVDEIVTGWGLGDEAEELSSSSDGPLSAAMVHWMHQCSGMIRLYRNGHLFNTSPLEEIEFQYPGVGRATGWTLGHPEPVTLSRLRPELNSSANVMVLPESVMNLVRWASEEINHGHISVSDAAAVLQGLPPDSAGGHKLPNEFAVPFLFRRAWSRIKGLVGRKRSRRDSDMPELFALARGRKGGKEQSIGASLTSAPARGMGGATGVPLAVGLRMLIDGQISAKGVHPPETCIDPNLFFDALAPLCTPPQEDGRSLLSIATA
jgi:saccharopine dehydrogenase-like NADP-dependent oxidoreductase